MKIALGHFMKFTCFLPATKVVDGTVYAFVLGERTWKLHLPATKVVDGTVCDLVLGGRTSNGHLPIHR